MSLQAVKAVEIGDAVQAAASLGSAVHDEIGYEQRPQRVHRVYAALEPRGRARGRRFERPRHSRARIPETDLDFAASPGVSGLRDVRDMIANAIADDPPAQPTEPGIIRRGYNAELDELRNLSKSSKQIIAAMEERERKRTGIGSLKIRYNQVFGLLHRNLESQSASGARRISNASKLSSTPSASLHPGAERIRTQSPRRRRAHRSKSSAASSRIARLDRRSSPRVFVAPLLPSRNSTCSRISPASPPSAITRARIHESSPDECSSVHQDAANCSSLGGRHPVIEQLLEQRASASCPTLSISNDTTQPNPAHHRPQHGRQIHLPSPSGADRASWRRSAPSFPPQKRACRSPTASSRASALPTISRAAAPLFSSK